MAVSLKLYDLGPSPNNIKVRCALAYKKLPYERVAVDPANREAVVKVSGQPLTPVLLHGDTVVFDSYAILRYLDANFRDTAPLFSADRATLKSIEQWELFARTDAGPGISKAFGQLREANPDPEVLKTANDMLNRSASRVEEALSKGDWLVGGSGPSAADFTVGTMLFLGAVTDAAVKRVPAWGFFQKHMKIDRAPKTLSWVNRVMEFDRQP
ncbi:MAG TPA: glutathione S-transferase family protein [Candidatus Polarisedimenticolia bacterium]|jgi:glutathione S-transferase|nr:glutathione S-transferase family protein [Candidatus Polarisedimenticolia bacterium]